MSQDYKKIAMLMLCHTLPDQINDFIDRFDNKYFGFFLHVDKKSDIQPKIHERENVWFVPEEKRVDVRWGRYSMVQATLMLIELALETGAYDYYWLCSGQDFPIKKNIEIKAFFKEQNCSFISLYSTRNNVIDGRPNTERDKRCEIVYPSWMIGKTYWQRGIKKLYNIITGGTGYTFSVIRKTPPDRLKMFFGSQWWCLSLEAIEWVDKYVKCHNEVIEFFKTSLVPDESFFQTIVMNGPFSKSILQNLVYVDWSEGKSSPKVLNETDYERIVSSEKLLARKVDSVQYPDMYKRLLRISEDTVTEKD